MKAVVSFINWTHSYWEGFSLWQKYSLLGGVCWQYQWWVFPFVCQDAPSTHSREKAFRSFPHHRPIHHLLSRLLCCFLPWLKAAALWYELLFTFLFPLLGFSWRRRKKNILLSYLQLPVKSFPCLCVAYLHSTSAELQTGGWETTKQIRPNYSASLRAFLSCLGYALLTVRVVWLT